MSIFIRSSAKPLATKRPASSTTTVTGCRMAKTIGFINPSGVGLGAKTETVQAAGCRYRGGSAGERLAPRGGKRSPTRWHGISPNRHTIPDGFK